MRWSRHGVLPVLLNLPLLAVGRIVEQRAGISQDQVLSVSPVLWTGGLVALLFVWLRRITESAIWSYALSLIAGFCTLLWPYAYIGLEPKQSLCVVAAAYLALATAGRATYTRSLWFGLACAGAISLKISGTYLIPAVAFLIGVSYASATARCPIEVGRGTCWASWLSPAWSMQVTPSRYPGTRTRGASPSRRPSIWFVDDPVTFLFHLFELLASPAKGLIVYSPVCLLALLAMRQAWHRY